MGFDGSCCHCARLLAYSASIVRVYCRAALAPDRGACAPGPQVTGDTAANMDLRRAVAAHRARREKDKLAIMTMVRPAGECKSIEQTEGKGHDGPQRPGRRLGFQDHVVYWSCRGPSAAAAAAPAAGKECMFFRESLLVHCACIAPCSSRALTPHAGDALGGEPAAQGAAGQGRARGRH
jgi:hypothetical protein